MLQLCGCLISERWLFHSLKAILKETDRVIGKPHIFYSGYREGFDGLMVWVMPPQDGGEVNRASFSCAFETCNAPWVLLLFLTHFSALLWSSTISHQGKLSSIWVGKDKVKSSNELDSRPISGLPGIRVVSQAINFFQNPFLPRLSATNHF